MTTDQLAKLTPEEKRVKIAEACGQGDRWHIVKCGLYYRPNGCGYTDRRAEAWVLPEVEARKHEYPHDDRVTVERAQLPDYLNDLNAMRAAINQQSDSALFRFNYTTNLRKVIDCECAALVTEFRCLNAEAIDCANAFLLTLP